MINICKTDLQRVINYLDDAAKLYHALPMQSMKSRAHMIKQLTNKLRAIESKARSNKLCPAQPKLNKQLN